MTHHETPQPSRSVPPRRPLLATPAGAAALILVIVGLVALIALLPRATPAPSPSASPVTATCSAVRPMRAPAPRRRSTSRTHRPRRRSPSFGLPTTHPRRRSRATSSRPAIRCRRSPGPTPRHRAAWPGGTAGTYPTLDPESEGYDPNNIQPGWTLVLMPGVVVDDASHPSPSPGGPSASPTWLPRRQPIGGAGGGDHALEREARRGSPSRSTWAGASTRPWTSSSGSSITTSTRPSSRRASPARPPTSARQP